MIQAWLEARIIPEPNSGCWLWLGALTGEYGSALDPITRKIDRPHRIAYRHLRGNIVHGLCVCHHCDVPACCNPQHLFLGTKKENTADCVAKRRRARQDGIHNGNVKLTADDVVAIRRMSGTQQNIAGKFGVSQVLISKILHGRLWGK